MTITSLTADQARQKVDLSYLKYKNSSEIKELDQLLGQDRALAALERGGLVATEQAEQGITYAHKISPDEARIDWSRSATEVDCHIRGLSPFPGAWFEIDDARVKALMSKPVLKNGAPGELLDADGKLVIACGDGAVELTSLQRAGKRSQNVEEFLRGFPLEKGVLL